MSNRRYRLSAPVLAALVIALTMAWAKVDQQFGPEVPSLPLDPGSLRVIETRSVGGVQWRSVGYDGSGGTCYDLQLMNSESYFVQTPDLSTGASSMGGCGYVVGPTQPLAAGSEAAFPVAARSFFVLIGKTIPGVVRAVAVWPDGSQETVTVNLKEQVFFLVREGSTAPTNLSLYDPAGRVVNQQ